MSDNNEPLDLQKIEARLKAATPGPWVWQQSEQYNYGGEFASLADDLGDRSARICAFGGGYDDDISWGSEPDEVDAEFIANAPTDIAALLQRVKELEAELAEAKRTQVKDGGRGQLRPFPEPDEEE